MDHCLRWRLKIKAIRYDLFHIHLTFISFTGTIIWTHDWPAPNISGFIAQLVRASHRYREVTASSPVEVLSFFFFWLLTQMHKLRSQFFIWYHFRSSHMIISYTSHFHLSVNALKILNPVMKNRASLFPNFFEGRGHPYKCYENIPSWM